MNSELKHFKAQLVFSRSCFGFFSATSASQIHTFFVLLLLSNVTHFTDSNAPRESIDFNDIWLTVFDNYKQITKTKHIRMISIKIECVKEIHKKMIAITILTQTNAKISTNRQCFFLYIVFFFMKTLEKWLNKK